MNPLTKLSSALALCLMVAASPASAQDFDNNPPGWRGGPGTSPDYRYWHNGGKRYRFNLVAGGYYYSARHGYWHPRYGFWNQVGRCWWDNDNNPPGWVGGRGSNWENPPGWRGGPGASPDRFGRCR